MESAPSFKMNEIKEWSDGMVILTTILIVLYAVLIGVAGIKNGKKLDLKYEHSYLLSYQLVFS